MKSHRLMHACAAFVLLSGVASGAEEQLRFDPSPMVMAPTINDLSGTYTCKVTNVTNTNLAITEFKGGCGCIELIPALKALAPGTSTDLTIIFEFKDYVGPQKRKLILLTKAEGQDQAVRNEVLLTGDIPTPLTFNKKAVIWLYGEKVTDKEIVVQIKDGFMVEDLRVENPDANHFVKLASNFDHTTKTLSVKVTPTSTDIAVVSPTEKANLQLPYVVKYKLPSGVQRYEKFWVLIAKRPEAKPNAGKPAELPDVKPPIESK